jgi:hypothetical protein
VPAHLWSTLETVFQERVRILAKDIAKQLGDKPVAPLMAALTERKTSLYIFEEANADKDTSMRCSYLCLNPCAPHYVKECGQPVLWSAELFRCPEHCYKAPAVFPPNLPQMQKLDVDFQIEPLYLAEDSSVFDGQNVRVGYFDKDTRIITRFVIEE